MVCLIASFSPSYHIVELMYRIYKDNLLHVFFISLIILLVYKLLLSFLLYNTLSYVWALVFNELDLMSAVYIKTKWKYCNKVYFYAVLILYYYMVLTKL